MPTDQELARRKYRKHADHYDRSGPGLAGIIRKELVSLLELTPGETVFDVACGTGLSFPFLQDAIGETGHLVGIDLSSEMLEQAQDRVETNGWRNVILIQGPAEEVEIPYQADALIFCFTHDVLQSRRALRNVLDHAKTGARVAAFGPKWAPWWVFPINLLMYYLLRRYATTTEGLSRPWEHLARFVPDLHVRSRALGAFYTASGTAAHRRAA